uniref:helix-turn-helix domain-containing protein n=1 Tax=Nonomuraea solani TaxID=1144553 RepID=UPI0011B04C6E
MDPPRPSLAELGGAHREQALERYRILRAHLDDGVPLARVAAHAGQPYRTLQRWLADYRRDGLAGLARRPRCDAGTRRLPRAADADRRTGAAASGAEHRHHPPPSRHGRRRTGLAGTELRHGVRHRPQPGPGPDGAGPARGAPLPGAV